MRDFAIASCRAHRRIYDVSRCNVGITVNFKRCSWRRSKHVQVKEILITFWKNKTYLVYYLSFCRRSGIRGVVIFVVLLLIPRFARLRRCPTAIHLIFELLNRGSTLCAAFSTLEVSRWDSECDYLMCFLHAHSFASALAKRNFGLGDEERVALTPGTSFLILMTLICSKSMGTCVQSVYYACVRGTPSGITKEEVCFPYILLLLPLCDNTTQCASVTDCLLLGY